MKTAWKRPFQLMHGLLLMILLPVAWSAPPSAYEMQTLTRKSATFDVPQSWVKQWFGDMPEAVRRYPTKVSKTFSLTLPVFHEQKLPTARKLNATLVQKVFDIGRFFYPETVDGNPLEALKRTLEKEILRYEEATRKGESYFGETHTLKSRVHAFRPPVVSVEYDYTIQASGEDKGMTERMWFSLDTRTGEQILFNTLIPPAKLPALIKLARETARKDPSLKKLAGQIDEQTFSPVGAHDINERFMLTEQGMTIFLPAGTDWKALTLPYTALRPLLATTDYLPASSP